MSGPVPEEMLVWVDNPFFIKAAESSCPEAFTVAKFSKDD